MFNESGEEAVHDQGSANRQGRNEEQRETDAGAKTHLGVRQVIAAPLVVLRASPARINPRHLSFQAVAPGLWAG
jgi:hypothetical protein